MRNLVLAIAAAIAASMTVSGCGKSSGGTSSSSIPTGGGTTSLVSCVWTGGTCDQYGGTVDPTFAANLQTTCSMHGVAFASAACPATNQVAGHCDLGTKDGRTSSYFYYAPKYDSASAKADCTANVVGVAWVQ
ncbi:MAG TPA: hypothetical protein VLT47_02585 [Anaeromyxobacteraceae bacterium]|nr:hypothetical protein [Anaeromyxobacteraceae bacterium]